MLSVRRRKNTSAQQSQTYGGWIHGLLKIWELLTESGREIS
jgi:hypothetical protein